MLDWNRSHEYVLQRFFVERAEVTVQFAANSPTVSELIALRRCVPTYSTMPPAALRELLGNSGTHSLGDMPGRTARAFVEAAQNTGLTVSVQNTSYVGYLPYDKTDGCAWLIEDEEESEAVAKAMLAAGIPVESIEG